MLRFIAAATLALAASAAAVSLPQIASRYTVNMTMTLPYADLVEPMLAVYDAPNGREHVSYYDGQDVYLFFQNQNVTFEVVPVAYDRACFAVDGPVSLMSMFPDLSNFQPAADGALETIRGAPCAVWVYNYTIGEKVNSYKFYVNAETGEHARCPCCHWHTHGAASPLPPAPGAPWRYAFLGYDDIIGSHYDVVRRRRTRAHVPC